MYVKRHFFFLTRHVSSQNRLDMIMHPPTKLIQIKLLCLTKYVTKERVIIFRYINVSSINFTIKVAFMKKDHK